LQSLRRIARFTDRIWPLPAAARPRSANAIMMSFLIRK
jgi:hypothetical protein